MPKNARVCKDQEPPQPPAEGPKRHSLGLKPKAKEKLENLLTGFDQFEHKIGYQFRDRAYLLQVNSPIDRLRFTSRPCAWMGSSSLIHLVVCRFESWSCCSRFVRSAGFHPRFVPLQRHHGLLPALGVFGRRRPRLRHHAPSLRGRAQTLTRGTHWSQVRFRRILLSPIIVWRTVLIGIRRCVCGWWNLQRL